MSAVLPVSPTPRRVHAPSWLDLRLVVGVMLVLASIGGGALVVSASSRTERVWAVRHDIQPGIVLTGADVVAVSVRVPSGRELYYTSATSVTGQSVTRPLAAGELLPRSAVGAVPSTTTVTIPLGADLAPEIKAGQRITVWVSTVACPSAVVLPDTPVQDVQDARGSGFGSSGGQDVVVRLSRGDAQRVVEALALKGGTMRAGVVTGSSPSAATESPLTGCADGGS
jgi:hypothetical protein